MGRRKCCEADFEKWYARTIKNKGCLMGHRYAHTSSKAYMRSYALTRMEFLDHSAFGCGHGPGLKGESLLQTACEHATVYRNVLFDWDVGLWQRIALGRGIDPTHWGTGNMWAAAGTLRVSATIQRSSTAQLMTLQQDDLVQWAEWGTNTCV
jgi:hypothetical protein